jgi:hypothetical protein
MKEDNMTENDYIAEYIKEKRPEIISSLDFIFWKIGKSVEVAVSGIVNGHASGLKNIFISEKEEQDNDVQGDETENGIDTKAGV